MRVLETEEPVEHEVDLTGQPRQQFHTLVSGAVVDTAFTGTEGKHHNEGRDEQHAGDNAHTHFHTALAAVEQRVEQTCEQRLVRVVGFLCLFLQLFGGFLYGVLHGEVGVSLQDEALHEARADHTAHNGAEEADERLHEIALTYHEDYHEQTHAEGGAEVCERNELVLTEICREFLVTRKGNNGGVVAQERHDGPQRRHAREVEDRLHDGPEHLLYQRNHSELNEHASERAGKHTDAEQEEYRVEQKVVGRGHESLHHRGETHLVPEVTEEH